VNKPVTRGEFAAMLTRMAGENANTFNWALSKAVIPVYPSGLYAESGIYAGDLLYCAQNYAIAENIRLPSNVSGLIKNPGLLVTKGQAAQIALWLTEASITGGADYWFEIEPNSAHLTDSYGNVASGLATADGKTFYLDNNGKGKGLLNFGNGVYRYFDPVTGEMAKNKWVVISGTNYYFLSDGTLSYNSDATRQ